MKYRMWIGLCAVAVVAALCAFVLLGHRSPSEPQNATLPRAAEAPAPGFAQETSRGPAAAAAGPLVPARQAPPDAQGYRSERYRFELFYPKSLAVTEYDEGAGASTIVFQNPQEAKGFQIFIVPYGASRVSEARLKADEPSGVMQHPMPLSIDGAAATAFIGEDQLLGPTREVWMIRGGYLFEISAPQSLDDWLGAVMLTWKFI